MYASRVACCPLVSHTEYADVHMLAIPSPSKRITLKMSVVRVMLPILNFAAPIDISETAESRVVKFCTQVDYTSPGLRIINNP